MSQIRLGYTIGALPDHPKEADMAGVYNRAPWLTTPMNQIWLGYTIETLADHPNEPELLGYTLGTLADHPNKPEFFSIMFLAYLVKTFFFYFFLFKKV